MPPSGIDPSNMSIDSSQQIGQRIGYFIAVIINGALLVVLNLNPGWEYFSFLTPAFADVLAIVNISIAANLLANAIYGLYDAPRFKSSVQCVLLLIGSAVSLRLLAIFPFDVNSFWSITIKVVLLLGAVGSAIGAIVEFSRAVHPPTGKALPH